MTKGRQYIVSTGASTEPLVQRYNTPPIDGSLPQNKQSVINALARADSNGDQPDVDQQQVPAYSGMQAYLSHVGERSKSYYQPTYRGPPSKSVINDIMVKNVEVIRKIITPFLFMVGDLPICVHIVE